MSTTVTKYVYDFNILKKDEWKYTFTTEELKFRKEFRRNNKKLFLKKKVERKNNFLVNNTSNKNEIVQSNLYLVPVNQAKKKRKFKKKKVKKE